MSKFIFILSNEIILIFNKYNQKNKKIIKYNDFNVFFLMNCS